VRSYGYTAKALFLDQFRFQSPEESAVWRVFRDDRRGIFCNQVYVDQSTAGDFMAKSAVQMPAFGRFSGRLFFPSPSAAWRRLLTRFSSFETTKPMRAWIFLGIYAIDPDQTPTPYIGWSDCTFRDYIDIFRQFWHDDDVERIEKAEAACLKNARRELFTSDGAERAVSHYDLDALQLSLWESLARSKPGRHAGSYLLHS
jgi:hypothetical protein